MRARFLVGSGPARFVILMPGFLLALALTSGNSPAAGSAEGPQVDARIEIVWPHDGRGQPAPLETARFVNVEAYVFQRGTLNPVACNFPNRVILRWTVLSLTSGGFLGSSLIPAQDYWQNLSGVAGERVIRTAAGRTFPAWVFNNVPVPPPTEFTARAITRITYFFVEVEGADARTSVWAHGDRALTQLPYQRLVWGIDERPPQAVDALIQVVWPHDEAGQVQDVAAAPLVNIGVDLFHHPVAGPGDPVSVGFGFDRPVWLLRALNNGYLEPVKTGEKVRTTNPLAGTASWPRWVFNDVDVSAARDPANKLYFAVRVDGVPTHTTIWAHGADPRTYLPEKDLPAASCP